MPHIFFQNVKLNVVSDLAQTLTSEIATIIDQPEDWITYYVNEAQVIINNEDNNTECYVTVKWFERPEELKVKVAQLITDYLRANGFETVTIEFVVIEKSNFFENMKKY